ncbi:MAG: DUF2845 domain-containing protein [Gammaproteobacteria bacterium]
MQTKGSRFLKILAPLLIFLIAQPALAMRCGTKLVLKGDHQAKVLNYCGEPTLTSSRTILRSGPTRQGLKSGLSTGGSSISHTEEVYFYRRSMEEVIVEEWTYNLGPNRLMRVVRFENGYVSRVDELGYGYTE